ncbi:putative HTH-type transcriptional regulator YbaQ [Candidatus Arcanobacter lacustris]|uniref:Putative HTH-type transcriptional regulator YbaQ n=1 Tax=Candidatus Arcanibacter lacustris TaxID=1607817 RepID=A0A0F5MMS1_9RICK|nr:putative HTH-type transcriptional regulator YbaQ [Candidatus Arcanobacter lacustris]
MEQRLLDPITPGEILLEEYLIPHNISQNKLSRDIDVTVGRINDIIHGKRSITADTALRLAKYFNTSADLWLGLQAEYDIRIAKTKLGAYIERRICTFENAQLLNNSNMV